MARGPLPHLFRCLAILAFCAAVAGCGESPAGTTKRGDDAHEIDLTRYRPTFGEDFSDFDISAWGPGSKWIAHTPWAGDFGDAQFSDPEPGFPFATARHMLRIEAHKDLDGRWRSGLISSRDRPGVGGSGFAQQYGYFEIDAKLPKSPGVWPAFWLVSETTDPKSEIDVFEFYGNAPHSYHANVHVWADDESKFGDGHIVPLPEGATVDQFNRYGVRVTKDWITFFFNRKEVWRSPTRPAFRHPMYLLADLALGSGWPIDKVADPSFMYIRSINAYAEMPAGAISGADDR